ncbi:universal stress protein [Pseudonocardia abyssalis]|uniref:Universal stress protein n=1 Tax=Pseudonocardia abyssalis TaxID=2792008 RepID=A0ABS6UND4_9PSEU|nr:universal stress protein [Pseudonocardia abyssalis]MBW0115095.1 universal stress protein [Pseudonocardia abyssalis]MBW0133765.1 universal stress protein [Pseudonocardia abyssalis]
MEHPTVEDEDIAASPEVVVGTDGTATASRAVAWAATEARVRRLPLRIVHAGPYATEDYAPGRRRAAAILARAYTIAHRREPGVEAHTVLSDEAPVAALVRASRDAELLVVGLLSGHPGDLLVGSIAPALTARAHCPVTVVHSDHNLSGNRRTVVVGVEDVAADTPALTVAFADAARHASPVSVVHAWRRACDIPGTAAPQTVLLHELGPWRARWPDVPVEVRIVHGGADEPLLAAAHGARLMVVGTAGHNLAARAALGSTSRTLVRLGACPVTVVRRDLDLTAAGAPPARDAGAVRS